MDVAGLAHRELVRRLLRAGPDDPAWTEFFRRYADRVRLAVARAVRTEARRGPPVDLGPPEAVAEELTQEVFLRLLEGRRQALARFEGRHAGSIFTYLSAIAVNLVRDHFKRLRAQKRPPAAQSLDEPIADAEGERLGITVADAIAAGDPTPEEHAESGELAERIEAALGGATRGVLAARDRLVFRLYFVEGLTMDEIAAVAGIGLTPSGVEKCIRRIRSTLRDELGELDPRRGGRSEPISS